MNEIYTQYNYQSEDGPSTLGAMLPSTQVMDILEHMSDAIYTVDQQWRITYINRKAEEIWGRLRSELLGHNIWTAFPQAVGTTAYQACLRAMHERRLVTFEYFSPMMKLWLDVRVAPHGAGVVVYFSDITARKQTEIARDQQQAILQTIFDHIPVMIRFLSADGSVQLVNHTWERTLGWSLHEVQQQNLDLFEQLYPDPHERQRALHFAADGSGEWADFRVRRRDGEMVDITFAHIRLPDGTSLRIGQDITARKAAEAAERAQHQFTVALRDSLAALTGSLSVERVMQQILDSAAIVVPNEASSISLVEGESGYVAYLRGFTPEAQAFFKTYQFPITSRDFPSVLLPDTQVSSEWVTLPVMAWVRSFIGIPIKMRGEVIGLLAMNSATPHYFQPADLEKLQTFAHYAGLALENAYYVTQLEQKVLARTTELHEAKERVEALLNNSPDGILLVHSDLRIQQTNAAFDRLFACAPEASSYGSLDDLTHPENMPRLNQVVATVMRTHTAQQIEMLCYRQDGTRFEAEFNIGYITAATGTACLVCTIRDVTERKHIQNALAEERNLLRTLIDTIPDSIYVKDTNHRIVLINTNGAHVTGRTPEELIGKDDFAFSAAELATQFHAAEERLFRAELPMVAHEEYVTGFDGKPAWLAITKVPLRNLQGAIIGLVGINRDISEQKQRERQLRYYASLQENVSDAVIATDLDFQIQSWNRAAETLYGWRAEEVIGQSIDQILLTHDASAEESDKHAWQAMLEQGQWQGEIIHRRKDGTELYMLSSVTILKNEQGLAFGVVAVNRNITERKRADAALREQRDFLQLVINSVPDLILVKDAAGQFQLVNEPAAHIYGTSPAAMVGKTDADMHHNPDEVAFLYQKDQEALASRQLVFIAEQAVQGRYYQTSKIPLQTRAEQPARLLIVASDITARKQAEATLQQALQIEKELGELKSRFISMATHEFRNPLSSILLLTEVLRDSRHKLSDEQIGQRLGKIEAKVHYLKGIMEDVLQLTRLQARRTDYHPVWFDLDTLCRDVLEEFHSESAGTNRLVYTYDGTLGKVYLDRKLMCKIITNLISNALKYSAADTIVRVSLVSTAEALVLQVHDEGIGIPTADLDTLFEPFHRAANVDTIAGTGLGLTITKEAVELQGGSITVESQQGVGTTFTVSIPLPDSCGIKHTELLTATS